MEYETEHVEDESFLVAGKNVRYIVEGSSIPKAFERATSILSGKTVTQYNQITTGNIGDDPARGIGYAAGVTFGRNVLGNTSIVPRLIAFAITIAITVMPEEDNSDVDIAGEVDLTAEGSVKRPDTSVQQDQIGQETSTIAIVASEEGTVEGFTEEQFGCDSGTNKRNLIDDEQIDRQVDTCGRQETLLDKVLNDFPETKTKEHETNDIYDPIAKRHQCKLCEKRSYNARKDLYRHTRKEHPSEARDLIHEIKREMKANRHSMASTESEMFHMKCTECGKPAEPSQRNKYLCRCQSCDLEFRISSSTESVKGKKSGASGCKATVFTEEAASKQSSEESGKSGKLSDDSAWWEEGSQPDVDAEAEVKAEMDASEIESLLGDEEDHGSLDEQRDDIDYEELVDSDYSRDGSEQKQCETCFRYFNSQFRLQSHLSAPHRCQVCCKKFSSHVRLMQHARFHGKKISSITKKSKTSGSVKAVRRKVLKQDCEYFGENTKNKPAGIQNDGTETSNQKSEEQVRRSSRKTKGINKKYDTPIVKTENIDETVDSGDEDFIPEKSDVENDDISEETKEEKTHKRKYSPRKARKGKGRRKGTFPCTECDKVISSAQGLRNHLRGHIGYKKKYRPPPQSKCEKCGVEITSFQGYQNHMRVHQFDEESYTCDICHKHFSTYEKLEDHELLHEDVKLSALDTQNQDQFFSCKLCVHRLYKYKMRSQLYRHFRVHHPASAKSLMEEEMRIRRIGKAIRIIKEQQSMEKIKSEDNLNVSENTVTETGTTNSEKDSTTKANNCVEEVQDLKNDTRVFIDVSSILDSKDNSIQDSEIDESIEEGGNGENRKTKDQSEKHQPLTMEVSNECLNCGLNFPDQKSLCNHAITCSVQLQKYVSHLEKRRNEAKRYSMKRLEASRRILEFTCGSCGEKFTLKSKLRRHITEKHGERNMNDCQVCGQDFESNEELGEHVKIHPEYDQRNVLCAKCGKRFSSQIQYEAHERKLCGPAEQCDICGRIFKFAITLERHKKRSHVEKDYYVDDSAVLQEAQMRDKSVCAVCNEKFKDEAAAKTHLKSSHSSEEVQKPFSCPTCGDRFKRYPHLIHHRLIHTGEKPYKCKICNAGFRSVSILAQHKYRHTTTKRFKCSVCGAQFIKLYALKVHLARHTTELNCPACHRVFQSQESLEEHYRIHTGDRPFKCRYCGEGFTSLRYVNRHMTVKHSDVEVTVRTTQFTCDVPDCNFSCTHISTLKYHKLRHTGEKPYECDVCGKCFRSSSRLNEHKRVHTGARPYKCQYCDDFFSNSTAVRRHERRHVQANNFNRIAKRSDTKGPHTCDWCGKVFKKKNDHSKHIRVHTGEMPYQCKYCLRKFRTNSAWRRHEREHTGEAPRFVGDCMCNVCGKRVAKNQITAHMQLHRGDKPFECDFCDETFESKQALSGHHRKAHGKEKTVYQCTLCCENFKDHTKWKHHMMLHTGEKLEKCDVCGKCFRLKKELKRHMLGHSDPQHVCPFCKKAVRTPSQLKHHIRTHTGEKPHKCEECDRTFNQAYALKRHMMTHTDEKPHVCEECDSAYKTLDALQRHQRKKHGFVSATKRFPCPLCDREFLSAWHLDEHIKFHAGTRPHKCSYCERTFNSKLDLENHVPLHTGHLKYECEECGRGFKTEVECAEHLGTHTEETKSYPCKFCSESFATTAQLRRHVDSHITMQDGQVYVLGSPEPTTVFEIVTEPPQTVVETTTISITSTE